MHKLHFQTQKISDSLRDKIQTAYQEILPVIENKLDLPDINIYISDDSEKTIPETGLSGNSVDQNTIYVYIDSDFPNIENDIESKIKSTLAHEINHCVRSTKYYWGENLLEAMITEGLADHFDLEINYGEVKPWCKALDEKEIEKYLDKAKSEFDNKNYDHAKWFFGTTSEIPKWVGYSIGFKLVGDYLTKTGRSASELTLKPASIFISQNPEKM